MQNMASLSVFIAILHVLVLACTSAYAEVEYALFEKWIDLAEHKIDLQLEKPDKVWPVWKENAEFVFNQNSLGLSYKLALNEFTHLTPKDLTGGIKILVSPTVSPAKSHGTGPLPPSIDWKKKGGVTPVENQGQCGTAAALATVDSVASFGFVETGQLKMPSVEEYVDCCLNGSCHGSGFGILGFDCIAKMGGLACESDYPVNRNHTCKSKEVRPCVVVKGGSQVMPKGDETALAAALVKQPIAVGIDANHSSFQLYRSGIYYEPLCSSTKLDHAVLLVGYGTENGEDYWLVKNSWGLSWGMGGYMMMSRNKGNNCGIATAAIFPIN